SSTASRGSTPAGPTWGRCSWTRSAPACEPRPARPPTSTRSCSRSPATRGRRWSRAGCRTSSPGCARPWWRCATWPGGPRSRELARHRHRPLRCRCRCQCRPGAAGRGPSRTPAPCSATRASRSSRPGWPARPPKRSRRPPTSAARPPAGPAGRPGGAGRGPRRRARRPRRPDRGDRPDRRSRPGPRRRPRVARGKPAAGRRRPDRGARRRGHLEGEQLMRTAFTDLVGVPHPIVGFNRSPGVVAAVTNAGGFGVLGASAYTPAELDAQLTWIDEQTEGKPYGVDLLVPEKFATGEPGNLVASLRAQIPDEHLAFVRDLLDRYGVPEVAGNPEHDEIAASLNPDDAAPLLDVAFRHPIRLIANDLGPP